MEKEDKLIRYGSVVSIWDTPCYPYRYKVAKNQGGTDSLRKFFPDLEKATKYYNLCNNKEANANAPDTLSHNQRNDIATKTKKVL